MYKIRIACHEDANGLSDLNYKFNGVQIEPHLIIESMNQSSEQIAVALFENVVVGFASAQVFKSFCYKSKQGEITEMYVEERHRKHGIASKLIEYLESQMVQQGVKSIKILTGSENINALKTYNKAGYREEDERMLSKGV